jgi:hypothetical protein
MKRIDINGLVDEETKGFCLGTFGFYGMAASQNQSAEGSKLVCTAG